MRWWSVLPEKGVRGNLDAGQVVAVIVDEGVTAC